MKPLHWTQLLSRSVEDADALSKISTHQSNIDRLISFDGRISVDGEAYTTDVLKLLYLEAADNVCSGAVLDFLGSLDSEEVRVELVNDVFLDMSIKQQKKTYFLSELKRRRKKQPVYSEAPETEVMSQYAVEDALMKLGLRARFNTAAKRIEISGFGADALYEVYSRSNILSILPSLIRDNLRADGVKGIGQGTKMIEQYLFNIADANRYNPIR